MKVIIKEYASKVVYRLRYGDIERCSKDVIFNEIKAHVLFSGELDHPPIKRGDTIFLSKHGCCIIIDRVVRCTDNSYICYTASTEEFIDKTIPPFLIEKKELWDKEYSKTKDKYITEINTKNITSEHKMIPEDINFERMSKLSKLGWSLSSSEMYYFAKFNRNPINLELFKHVEPSEIYKAIDLESTLNWTHEIHVVDDKDLFYKLTKVYPEDYEFIENSDMIYVFKKQGGLKDLINKVRLWKSIKK